MIKITSFDLPITIAGLKNVNIYNSNYSHYQKHINIVCTLKYGTLVHLTFADYIC